MRLSPAAMTRPPALASAVPGGDDAAGAGDDRDQRQDVVGLELGLDHQIDVARRQHAIGVAVAAIARQPHRLLDLAEDRAVGVFHQQRARRHQHASPTVAQRRTRSARSPAGPR